MKQKKRLYRRETRVEPAVALRGPPPRSHAGHLKILSLVNTLAREKLHGLGDTRIYSCKTRDLDTAWGKPSTADGTWAPAAGRRQEHDSVQPHSHSLAHSWEKKTFPKLASSKKLALKGIVVRSTSLQAANKGKKTGHHTALLDQTVKLYLYLPR